MSPRMKRVLYALAVGLVFVLLTSITDAATPQSNLRERMDASPSTTQPKVASSIRVTRKADPKRHTQMLFLQQQFLQPTFIMAPARHAKPAQPAYANQFVPLSGSGQNAFRDFGFGGYGSRQQDPQQIHRISFGK